MVIKSLRLDNFQGIRSFTLDLNGKSASIYGANEAGKTTIFNAITWLLFGQASTGVTNFTPKTIDESGEVHHLDHSVHAVFICDDGSELALMRLYHEIYTKKRGSANDVFSGHTTEYFIDGVPVAEKSYTDTLLRMFGSVETMRLLSMPDYFPERFDWKSRRQLLLDICGDITDADVLAAYLTELGSLPSILKKPGNTDQLYTVDEYRAIAQRAMADINRDLQNIPARIDEAVKAKPDMAGTASREDVKADVERLRQNAAALESSKRNATADSMRAKAESSLLEAKNKLEDARRAHDSETRTRTSGVQSRIDTCEQSLALLRRSKREHESDIDTLKRHLEGMELQRSQLSEEYTRAFNDQYRGDDTCPACGQHLPQEALDAAIAKFNTERSMRLEGINARGRAACSKEMIAAVQDEISELEAKVRVVTENISIAESDLTAARSSVPAMLPFDQTPVYGRLMIEVNECDKKLGNADALVQQFLSTADREIQEANDDLSAALRKLAAFETADRQEARIAELKSQEKELSEKYEIFERGVSLCETFVRNKVSMLTDRINRHFDHVRFILFAEQLNGGLKECCEVAVPASDGSLIPYAFSNTAARLNAGLEIISVMGRHFGAALPVVVDNAESVSEIDSRGIQQLIRLVVSPADRALRLEINAKSTMEVA